MVIIAATCLLLTCRQQADEPAAIRRLLPKHQIEKYSVDLVRTAASGTIRYKYEMRVSLERGDDRSPVANVDVAFQNLHAAFDQGEAPVQRHFGSAAMRLTEQGFPLDLSISGENGVFVIPFLTWYLPKDSGVGVGEFTVADTEFDKGIHVKGTGRFGGPSDVSMTVKLELGIGQAGQSLDKSNFSSTATFNSKTGVLLTSDGEFQNAGFDVAFHIKRR